MPDRPAAPSVSTAARRWRRPTPLWRSLREERLHASTPPHRAVHGPLRDQARPRRARRLPYYRRAFSSERGSNQKMPAELLLQRRELGFTDVRPFGRLAVLVLAIGVEIPCED